MMDRSGGNVEPVSGIYISIMDIPSCLFLTHTRPLSVIPSLLPQYQKKPNPITMKSKAQPMTNGVVAVPKNISCLLYGPGDARYEEHPLPILTDPYDVLVRIQFVGVCGSDVCYD
jgi:hypothetical protein